MVLFTDGSDLEGINSVLDIKYIKLLMIPMKALCSWPYEYLGRKEPIFVTYYRCQTFFVESVCVIPGMLFVRNNTGKLSFFELGHNYITCMMNQVAVIRLTLTFRKSYFDIVGRFLTEIHLFNLKDRSEFATETNLLVHKISHFYTSYLMIVMVLGIIMFNALPLYNNFASGVFSSNKTENAKYELSVYFSTPFEYQHDFKGYLVMFFFNWYISFVCSVSFCMYDLLVSLMVFHVWGHLRILISTMEKFPKPKDLEWYTLEERKQVLLCLKDILTRHKTILDFLSEMTNTFGFLLFVYYGFHQAACCILLLECSQLEATALLRYGPLTIIVFQQLIQISIVFELLGATTGKLIDAAYSLPWECMDTNNRKIVYVLLRQCQKSLNIKALGMVDVGCKTMITIIKTSFSYFIMLRTVTE